MKKLHCWELHGMGLRILHCDATKVINKWKPILTESNNEK